MVAQMLAPAAVLIAWSLVMLAWTALTRFPAMKRAGIDLAKSEPGGRGQDLEGRIEARTQWKAHNYAHLMEQPTLFYAAVMIIALLGAAAGDVLAAWVYVALRIVHSLWQSLVNRVPVRFTLFLLSTLALAWLAGRALALTLFADPAVLS